MTSGGAAKVCPMCAETIKAAAKVCPCCQTRQARFALWQQELPGALAVIALVGLACAAIAWWFPDEIRPEGRIFARHRDELRVERIVLDRATKGPNYWLLGYVTNLGDHPWRVRELEVRFLDAQGHLVDVRNPTVGPFVVQPHREHAFRVDLGTLTFIKPEIVQSVRVQTATDGFRPVEPD